VLKSIIMHLLMYLSPGALFALTALMTVTGGCEKFPGKVIARSSDLLKNYDYIVVGGGTSGLVVANRLSENQGK
jgi:hypothetical protein